jgi:hypothetical protein
VDSTQYAVIPFQYVGAPAPASDAEPAASAVYDAMRHWDGLHLASEMSVSDAVRREGEDALTLEGVSRIARSVHAGRVVWGRVRVTRDSLVVRAGVYDALTEQNLREVTRVVRPGSLGALPDLDFRSLAADLLRTSRAAAISTSADRGTSSFAAWQAFERGAQALSHWDVVTARAELERAAAIDPAYPQANLWLAHLRFLSDDSPKEWATPLMAAVHGRALLDAREQAIAEALSHLGASDYPAGCRNFADLKARDSLDAMAWLGLANCQAQDRAVVPSARSSTGFAFRSSYEGVWRAVTRALEIAPEAFVLMPYERLRSYLPVENNRLRAGSVGTDVYVAWPDLAGDSILYAPVPAARFGTVVAPPGAEAALRFNRARVLALLELLTRRMPESADAFEALTNLLETRDEITGTPNGRFSALSALDRARSLATADPDQRIRLAVVDVRLHLKLGDFARAAATADSVLGAERTPTQSQAYWLEGLAAYAGRAGLAARYDRLHGTRELRHSPIAVPAAEDAVAALLMRSALGICDD